MWLDYKQYNHWPLIDEILKISQQELKWFLETKTPYDMASYKWFEKIYGHPMGPKVWNWYAVPNLRASQETEWSHLFPELTKAAKNLPGVVNFSLNAIAPGGEAPFHSDYDYDMRQDLSKTDKVFVILLGVDIAESSLEKCGFQLGDEKIKFRTNDIISFDGSVVHGSWNFTDRWRYTINMDIKQEHWKL
jgi:hypothetical protein